MYYRFNIVTGATLLHRLVDHIVRALLKQGSSEANIASANTIVFLYIWFFFMFGQVKHSDKVISREYGQKNDQAEF